MADQQFSVGDVVELKSGGPTMTIIAATPPSGSNNEWYYTCAWFAGEKADQGTFAASALRTKMG